jgi:hypothetical protein
MERAVRIAEDYRAKAVQLLDRADRQGDPAIKAAYIGMAGVFALLAKRAKLRADLQNAGLMLVPEMSHS